MTHSDRHSHACPSPSSPTARIRRLNDDLRRTLIGGRLLFTPGIRQLEAAALKELLLALVSYDDFTPDNDPHGEHDFGSLTIAGEKIFWKIDYYDRGLVYGSPDPADPDVTTRVLTVMLAGEY